jgi:predicted permease
MEKQITPGLKYTFLVHGIMMTVFGLTYLFVPVLWGDLTGCLSNVVPQAFRALSVAILALAIGSFLAFRETSWDKVKIMAQMECITNVLWPIVILLGLFFWDLPGIAWMYFVVMSGFAIAFNVFYFKG